MSYSSGTWATQTELAFLGRLGTHAPEARGRSRVHLLKGYLAGCALRADWGAMDKRQAVAFAEAELERLCG